MNHICNSEIFYKLARQKSSYLFQLECQQLTLRNQYSILQKVPEAYLGRMTIAILCSMLISNFLHLKSQKFHFSQESDFCIPEEMKVMKLLSEKNLFASLNCCDLQMVGSVFLDDCYHENLLPRIQIVAEGRFNI